MNGDLTSFSPEQIRERLGYRPADATQVATCAYVAETLSLAGVKVMAFLPAGRRAALCMSYMEKALAMAQRAIERDA